MLAEIKSADEDWVLFIAENNLADERTNGVITSIICISS